MLKEVSIILIVYTLYQIIEIGIIDGIEYRFVNKDVFVRHNFPDILRRQHNEKDRHNFMLAVLSGIICGWPLLISLAIKILIAVSMRKTISKKVTLYSHIVLALLFTFADGITLATFDKSMEEKDPFVFQESNYTYRNHILLYKIHAFTELASFISILIQWKKYF